ncbi:MAG: DUF3568 family protein [Methylotenera sp.]
MRFFSAACLLLANMTFTAGCIPAMTTAAGVGGSAALNHTLTGTTYRTFTAPAAKVRVATVNALSRMKITVVSEGMQDKSNVILFSAKTSERNIEIQLEPISANTTRMKVAAKKSMFLYDTATAEEIILQTKKYLG